MMEETSERSVGATKAVSAIEGLGLLGGSLTSLHGSSSSQSHSHHYNHNHHQHHHQSLSTSLPSNTKKKKMQMNFNNTRGVHPGHRRSSHHGSISSSSVSTGSRSHHLQQQQQQQKMMMNSKYQFDNLTNSSLGGSWSSRSSRTSRSSRSSGRSSTSSRSNNNKNSIGMIAYKNRNSGEHHDSSNSSSHMDENVYKLKLNDVEFGNKREAAYNDAVGIDNYDDDDFSFDVFVGESGVSNTPMVLKKKHRRSRRLRGTRHYRRKPFYRNLCIVYRSCLAFWVVTSVVVLYFRHHYSKGSSDDDAAAAMVDNFNMTNNTATNNTFHDGVSLVPVPTQNISSIESENTIIISQTKTEEQEAETEAAATEEQPETEAAITATEDEKQAAETKANNETVEEVTENQTEEANSTSSIATSGEPTDDTSTTEAVVEKEIEAEIGSGTETADDSEQQPPQEDDETTVEDLLQKEKEQEEEISTTHFVDENHLVIITEPDLDKLRSYLYHVSDSDLLDNDFSSPQFMAMMWINQGIKPTKPLVGSYKWLIERYIIAVLYYSLDGDTAWTKQANFLNYDTSVCNWNDVGISINNNNNNNNKDNDNNNNNNNKRPNLGIVECKFGNNEQSGEFGGVSWIRLDANNLDGTIPAEISHLPYLRNLELQRNNIKGTLPTTIGQLTNLNRLELYDNQIIGTIPTEIGNLGSNANGLGIIYLLLSNNDFSGTIPTEIFASNVKLRELKLSKNRLNGTIPATMKNVQNLNYFNEFDISFNSIIGTIPTTLGELQQLGFLRLNGNQLKGSIPSELGKLSPSELSLLRVDYNLLTGSVPTELGQLSALATIRFNNNDITGDISSTFCDGRKRIGSILELTADCSKPNPSVTCACCSQCV